MSIEIKNYAPVIIPTLNRFGHFKRCLESLERCSGADKTDVHVALDYPPSEKYVEGWKKIDEYLTIKFANNGFRNLIVIRRDRNYGVCNANGNYESYMRELKCQYDRYVFTEDDNEFSPNFLEYINWGLEFFKNDKAVFAICGFKNIKTDDIKNNVYKLNEIFSAWGYGSWIDRYEEFEKLNDHALFHKIIKDASIFDAFTTEVRKLSSLTYQLAMKTFHGDFIVSLLPENEKWCIFPKVNKVRNWGLDGSGQHGVNLEAYEKGLAVPIDKDKHFTPVIVEDLFSPIVYKRFKAQYKVPVKSDIRSALTFLCFKITGYIPVSNKKSKWFKVRLQKVQ